MKKIGLLTMILASCLTPASAQTTQQTAPSLAGGVPNPVGGVPNPVTPLGVDPRNQLPPSGETGITGPQNSLDAAPTPETHLTPLGRATVQAPIGSPHALATNPSTNTQPAAE
jgi:hypothetical protein